MKKIRLVDNAKSVWRFNSARLIAGVVVIQTYWMASPTSWIEVFPKIITSNIAYITLGMTILAAVAQYFHQDLPSDKAEPTP